MEEFKMKNLLMEFENDDVSRVTTFDSNTHPELIIKKERQVVYKWCEEVGYGFTTDKCHGNVTIHISKDKSDIKSTSKTKNPTDQDLQCFIKDFALPIIPREPYLSHFVDLYDSQLQTKKSMDC